MAAHARHWHIAAPARGVRHTIATVGGDASGGVYRSLLASGIHSAKTHVWNHQPGAAKQTHITHDGGADVAGVDKLVAEPAASVVI